MRAETTEVAGWLKARDRIAVVTHLHPDGDALGSSIALALALRAIGKRAFACCQDGAPDFLDMLPTGGNLFPPEDMPFEPEAVIAVDCAALNRLGRAAALLRPETPLACVDHHLAVDVPASPALVDPRAAAAGELIGEVIDALGAPLDGTLALCLYVAVSTDTGNFSFDCTTPGCLRLTARCLEAGLDLNELNYALFRRRTAARTKLLGRALNGLEFSEGGRLALMRVRRADFAACGAADADTEGIVNFGIDAAGVEIALLAVELEGAGGVKFSARSRGEISVAAMLAPLGGGGHAKAAGLTLRTDFDAAVDAVMDAARKALDNTGGDK
ncbi:MAG: DHH family phosphoesterase [Clostridia bacterium]|nr:DHH family phosphoesterase [Clostridia bacterium]